jgi:hypothetical protein
MPELEFENERRVKKLGVQYEYTPDQIKELIRCKKSCLYFVSNYVKIYNEDQGIILFNPYDYQKELLENYEKYRFNIGLLCRQSGKTTVVAAYALWFAIFNDNKNIGIVSNKEDSAKSFLARLKEMYELLPGWLKPGVIAWAETSVKFENKTKIRISATSKDSFRGEPMSLVICDELAFVDPQWKADEFWASNYPTISASKTAKIIIISTPNGMYNKFHELYSKAEKKQNTFVPYFADWTRVPGRDEKWAAEQLANLGQIKFAQEFSCKFVGSSSTVLDPPTIERILNQRIYDPKLLDLNNKFRVYEKPKDGSIYVIGVDVAKGTGEHYSTMQVLKIVSIDPLKVQQVAVYEDNMTDVYRFSEIVNRTCYYYNKAYLMIENNGEGAPVVNRIWWEYENEYLVCTGTKAKDLGIRATKATKPIAVLFMKKVIEGKSLKVIDYKTIKQLSSFIDKGNNKFTGGGQDDDLVSALYWALYIFCMDVLDEKFEFRREEAEDEGWGILSDVDTEEEEVDWSWMRE